MPGTSPAALPSRHAQLVRVAGSVERVALASAVTAHRATSKDLLVRVNARNVTQGIFQHLVRPRSALYAQPDTIAQHPA